MGYTENSKNVIFWNLHFLLIPCQKTSHKNNKGEKKQNTACNRGKNLTGVNFDVLTVFLGEHVKCLRQQCSWLDQKKSVFFQSWFSIVQNSSESIRRSRITSQVLFRNHFLGGGELRVKNNVKINFGNKTLSHAKFFQYFNSLCFGRYRFRRYSLVTLTFHSFDVLGVLDLILFWCFRSLSHFFYGGGITSKSILGMAPKTRRRSPHPVMDFCLTCV